MIQISYKPEILQTRKPEFQIDSLPSKFPYWFYKARFLEFALGLTIKRSSLLDSLVTNVGRNNFQVG